MEVGIYYRTSQVLDLVSQQRGRTKRPIHKSTLSRWIADLGWEKNMREFSEDHLKILIAVSQHYASGGSRAELMKLMENNTKWYQQAA